MKDFKQNNKFGGGNRGGDRGGFRGGGNFGKRDFGGQREMFDAVCAKCGKTCQVPFRPNGERPVYCRDCFGDNKPDRPQGQSNFSPRNDFPRREFNTPPAAKSNDAAHINIQRQLDAINAKLDRLIQKAEAPQKPAVVISNTTKESLGEVVANAQKTVKKESAKKESKKSAAKKK